MTDTWRIAYRMMQELGIKFEVIERISNRFVYIGKLLFTDGQHHYRIAPEQIAPTNWCDIYRAAQVLGVKFDYKIMETERWVEVGSSEPFMVLCFHRYRLHIEESPQRTIEINGVKVKAPVSSHIVHCLENNPEISHYEVQVRIETEADAEAFKAAMEGKK